MPPVRRPARLAIFFATLIFACPLPAQDASTGAIRGTVLDPDGRAVASATVAIVSTTTGLARSCMTDDQALRHRTAFAGDYRRAEIKACRRRSRGRSMLM